MLTPFAWRGLAAGLIPLPGELLSGRSHSKWGELLYISGGISHWTTLLFPEASIDRCDAAIDIDTIRIRTAIMLQTINAI